ncbi:MAG: SipW-dependent-type signal peptide-containing protein [Gracilibacteraceae bacterium]|jgi:predicted ribosomally synthesized peptide with SipW-like signal peptide|nr:SipW-dependent-type signal peptide-containing protein [Gracilibacteraceae bacterium]
MSNKRKFLLLGLCVGLLALISVGATLAYLTASTDTITNTFTVGKCSITLFETLRIENDGTGWFDDINYSSKTESPPTSYTLLPGNRMMKYAWVKIDPDSEDAYVFLTVTQNKNLANYVKDPTTLNTESASNNTGTNAHNIYWAFVDVDSDPAAYGFGHTDASGQDVYTNIYRFGKKNPASRVVLSTKTPEDYDSAPVQTGVGPHRLANNSNYSFEIDYTTDPNFSGADNYLAPDEKIEVTFAAYAIQASGFATWQDAYDALQLVYPDALAPRV